MLIDLLRALVAVWTRDGHNERILREIWADLDPLRDIEIVEDKDKDDQLLRQILAERPAPDPKPTAFWRRR